METITVCLFLLLSVAGSGIISRILPLPRPLIQVAMGATIGLLSDLRVELDPDIFFLFFLPPLLFLDGWRIPKDEMLRDGKIILGLALGLVVFTVAGASILIHWMMPRVPFPVAVALAAVLSPTDPIAVSAIAGRVPIPKRLMHILEGESLLNDASGLVCFRFAVATVLTGGFSLQDAALSFLWLAFGGITTGAGLTWAVTRARERITRRFGEDGGSQILIGLLIPFGAYLLAEHLHCSGILAAVAAGITMSYVDASVVAAIRLRQNAVWDMIQFAANGIIFVLLGEQLPLILGNAESSGGFGGDGKPWMLLVHVMAITMGLAALRLLWSWISLGFTMFVAMLRGEPMAWPHWRLIAATSLAGVRGAVTLAGILTLPVALPNGTPFPTRDLAILLAMGVILVSLISASLGLPLLLKGLRLPPEPAGEQEEDRLRSVAAEAAVTEIRRALKGIPAGHADAQAYAAAASRLMDYYQDRAGDREGDGIALARQTEAALRRLALLAVKAQRHAILGMLRKRRAGSETAGKLMRELDLLEEHLRSGEG